YHMRDFAREGRGVVFTADVRGYRYEKVRLSHPARHMAENATHALCALEVLASTPDFLAEPLDRERAMDAIARTEQPGRFEIFDGAPPVVIDSSHNEVSLKAAMQTAKALSPSKLVCVIG